MRYAFLAAVLTLSACNGVKRIQGETETTTQAPHQSTLFSVSCCQDSGSTSYPSFVPQSHVDLCENIRKNGTTINGDTYIAMHVDCGHGHHSIGDNYYPSTGY